MITCQEKALEHMKLGLFDVLPSGSMDGLTAEDFRLLLNGVGDINVQTLISYTSFNDESGESPDRLVAIKRYNSFTKGGFFSESAIRFLKSPKKYSKKLS